MGIRRSFKPSNEVSNGNFTNGTTRWAAANSSIAASNNTLTITGSGASVGAYAKQTTTALLATGSKIYMRMKARTTNAVCTYLRLRAIGSVTTGSNIVVGAQASPVQDTWYTMSGIFTQTVETGFVQVQCYEYYADAATATDKVLEVQEVFVFDCTSGLPADILALSDANLKAWCDLNIPAWFDGTLCGGKRIGGMR